MNTRANSGQDTARTQAELQVESIVQMVAALECDYDRLEELRGERERYSGLTSWDDVLAHDAEELAELEKAAGEYTDADEAREAIQEDPLSVEVRSAWASVGETLTPDEFRVVLCTGGPHVELVGDLSDALYPTRVRVLYRDWGASGEYYPSESERAALMTYLGCLYFGS